MQHIADEAAFKDQISKHNTIVAISSQFVFIEYT